MNDTPTMWQKFTNLPRWMQWAVIATVSLLTILAYSDYILVNADVWNTKADAIEERIKNAHDKGKWPGGIVMSSLVRGLGPVEEPQKDIDDANAGLALTQTINKILKAHSVKEDFRASPPTRLPPQTLIKLTEGTDNRVESLSVELKFEANVQTTMAIIAELESNPDIESISHVHLTKLSGAKKLSVRLTVVSWVYSPATRKGGGRLQ